VAPSHISDRVRHVDHLIEASVRERGFEIEHKQEPVFGALGLIAKQASSPAHPAGTDLDIAPEEQRHRQSQG
jgi:hypothetical protein